MFSTPPFIVKSEMKLNFANFHNIWRRKVPSRSFLWTNHKCESKGLLQIFCKLPQNFLDSSIYNVYRPVDISPSWGNVMRIIMADVVSVGTIKWSVISMQELTRQHIITLHHTPTPPPLIVVYNPKHSFTNNIIISLTNLGNFQTTQFENGFTWQVAIPKCKTQKQITS